MICKQKVKMMSRILSELRRHFERKHHLTADQQYREKYFPCANLGNNARVLYGEKLEEARDKYKQLDVPEPDHKRPYCHDVVEGKPFAFTKEHEKTGLQIHLLITFLRSGGELWGLEEYWTQVGVVTGNSTSTSEFSWSSEHISVSILISGQKNNVDLLWTVRTKWL